MSTTIIVALIAAFPPTLVALLALRQVKAVHIAINSRMDQLLHQTALASNAEGRDAERESHAETLARQSAQKR